jgi:selenocysteine lyase/cysteine desulfurase
VLLPSQRDLFDIPHEVHYLNCAYMSPQLRTVTEAGVRAMSRKGKPWQLTPADFFAESEQVRRLFAELVGADVDGVAIIPSVSYGVGIAAANLPVDAGQRILVLEDQFPSNVYPWMALAEERNAQLVTVPRPADHNWTPAILERIDSNTAVVAVPNCHWTDGTLVDLIQVGQKARETGAALVVDATQSLGAAAFDVAKIRPDFLVTATYKWLLGPYSLGFLYIAEKWRTGKPLEHGWIVRAGSENFGGLVDYTSAFQPGARRFDVGERSNFALLPMAAVAMRQILDWSVHDIADTIAILTAQIERLAYAAGYEVAPARFRASHLIGIGLKGEAPDDLIAQLAAKGVFISRRADKLRISPHLYNSAEDIECLFAALEDFSP